MTGDQAWPGGPRSLEELSRELHRIIDETDQHAEETLLMVIALEEIELARWPRRVLVRARWRRDLRASVRHIEGGDFTSKRLNTIGSGWIGQSRWASRDV